jgi:outer membrane protein assembly factor BamB
MGGTIYAGAYVYTSVKPYQIFCPVEDSMKYVRDDTTKARWFWTRPTTGTISTDPVMSSSVVYFSSDDKRNFAVNAGTGAVRNGWPTAVFSQAGRTRIAVDGTTSSVYFGGGDGKIYRYPKQ